MRIAIGLLAATVVASGCAHDKPAPKRTAPPPSMINAQPQKPPKPVVIKPDTHTEGRVAMVNEDARFAVLNFPAGVVPGIGTQLFVYREGMKTGELKVTGPQGENNTVADIVSGDVKVQDSVRTD